MNIETAPTLPVRIFISLLSMFFAFFGYVLALDGTLTGSATGVSYVIKMFIGLGVLFSPLALLMALLFKNSPSAMIVSSQALGVSALILFEIS